MAPGVGTLCPLIQVHDMPRSLAFYRGKLGFELESDSGGAGDAIDWRLLKLGGAWLMLNTAYKASTGMHCASSMRPEADLGRWRKEVRYTCSNRRQLQRRHFC